MTIYHAFLCCIPALFVKSSADALCVGGTTPGKHISPLISPLITGLFLALIPAAAAAAGCAHFTDVFVMMILLFAAEEDMMTRKIRNFYTGLLAFTGAVLTGAKNVGIMQSPILQQAGAFNKLISCVSFLVILSVLSLVSKGGFGGGDVKLVSASALVTGMFGTLSVFASAVFMISFFALLTAFRSLFMCKKDRKKYLSGAAFPFAPFFALAFILNFV